MLDIDTSRNNYIQALDMLDAIPMVSQNPS